MDDLYKYILGVIVVVIIAGYYLIKELIEDATPFYTPRAVPRSPEKRSSSPSE